MKKSKKEIKEINEKNYKVGCDKKVIDNCKYLSKALELKDKNCEKLVKQCKELKKKLKK